MDAVDSFCEVVAGTVPVEMVAESDSAMAFVAPSPGYTLAHILVVPKEHVADLLDEAGSAAVQDTLALVQEVAAGVVAEHGACQVKLNLGTYQHIPHLHWHIIAGDHI